MFVYCNNNPANYTDSEGNQPIRNRALMSSDSGYNVQARAYDNYKYLAEWSIVPPGKVVSGGLSVVGGLGLSGMASAGIATDSEGNSAIVLTLGIGGGIGASIKPLSFWPGAGGSVAVYNGAETVHDLSGHSVAIGGTLGLAGAEIFAGGDVTGASIPVAFALGLEFHALITYTWVIELRGNK